MSSLDKALGGSEQAMPAGNFYLRGQTLGGHLCHGPFPLQQALEGSASLVGQHPLFLDTETTGLAGGSGTYAFLIGLGTFEQGRLKIEQLLMRSHCEEKAMLQYLLQRIEGCDGLVTFNGKSFDIPLLQTRLLMNRLRFDLEDLPHLDLLPVARRYWSGVLENCKLETLEEQVLGLPRHGDVPGWMVPQLFFRFLQDGCARGLAQVAEHNRRDILAMVGLLAGLEGYAREPLSWQNRFRQQPEWLHLEDLAMGFLLFRERRFEESRCLLERSWTYLSGREAGPHLRRNGSLLARLRRRQGQTAESRQIWVELAERFPRDPDILEQVAKQQEHWARDFGDALRWVERALGLDRLSRGRRKRLLYRRQRLQGRLAPLSAG